MYQSFHVMLVQLVAIICRKYNELICIYIYSRCASLAKLQPTGKQVLILAGAQVNTSDSDDSPLHCSIRRGHVQTTRALLLAGALPTTFLAGTYPINLAAGLGQDEVVHDMIHKGSSVICLDAEGKTPLVRAISGGHVLTMKALLSAESGVSAAVANGCNVLHHAAQLNQTGAIDVLVEFGVDVNETGRGGGTALYHATDMAGHDAMLRLLELGASVNAADDSGLTPLHRATCLGYLAATEMLLRWGADETLPDNQGYLPAAWIQKGDAEQRLRKMLAHAPQDRAWRRRGFLVMCRARHAKLHAPARQSRRLRARRQREGAVGWTTTGVTARVGRGSGSGSSGSSATGQDHGSGGLTWLLEPANDDVFRLIIGFV